MFNRLKNKSDFELDEHDIDSEINNYLKRKNLKQVIQDNYDFEIPDYVLEDILTESDSIFLSINVAVLNNRISKENALYLKRQFIKKRGLDYIYEV